MRFLLEDVPDSVLWHYRVQLKIYALILRTYFRLSVADLRVVCLRPDNKIFSEKIDRFMSWRRYDVNSCLHLTGCGEQDRKARSQVESMLSSSQMVCARGAERVPLCHALRPSGTPLSSE